MQKMRDLAIFHTVGPYLAAIASIVTVALLVVVIYFTGSDLQWIAFLSGILVAAVIAMAIRTSHAELIIARHAAQLQATEEKLAQETKLHLWAEKAAATSKARLQLIDEKFPAMLAYIDAGQHCCYHNPRFRQWLGLNPDQVDGQLLREVLGDKFYGEIEGFLVDVMAGKTVYRKHAQKLADGSICHLSGQYIPDFDSAGKVTGFYLLYAFMAEKSVPLEKGVEQNALEPGSATRHTESSREKKLFDESFGEQASGWGVSAVGVTQAIEDDEFRLYCQAIMPINTDAGTCVHHEILLRMAKEEDNLLPPGAFLPVVERQNMMMRLDRWVVNQVLQWLTIHRSAPGTMFFINVTQDTLGDADFPDFVRDQLQKTGIAAGMICFEIEELDAALRSVDAAVFVQKIRQHGCHAALCSFGRERASFDLLRNIKVNFLKIDGGLVCNMLRDPVNLAKVTSINRVAHTIGIRTVAELVESDDIIAKLREIGVDFAQGFGIVRPHPLKELE